MAEAIGADQAMMTIDELARRAGLPVRTIREYHTMRLLSPPERRGRVGYYSARHVERLELIARLQRRGYSLAGIRDLLQAWAAGADLTSLLGVEPEPTVIDEVPLRLTRDELRLRIPALSGEALHLATEAGLIQPHGDHFLVRSPALLALVTNGTAAGIPIGDVLSLAAAVRKHLSALADEAAGIIADRMVPAMRTGHSPDGNLVAMLQRGRVLLLQGAASVLADRLAAALRQRSDDEAAGGPELLAALAQIRVGAVADAYGNIGYPEES